MRINRFTWSTIMKNIWLYLVALIIISSMAFPAYGQFAGGSGTAISPYEVANVAQLWNVRDYLSAYFIQTADINLETTDPAILTDFDTNTLYQAGDIIEFSDGYAYFCLQNMSTMDDSQNPGNTAFWQKMWQAAKGWDPIGDQVGIAENTDISKAFTGQYNGNNKLVYNLYINRGASASANSVYPSDGEDNVGLFGFLTNTSLKDTEIKNLGLINPRVTGRRGTGSLVGKVLNPYRTPSYAYTVYVSRCYAIPDANNAAYVRGFGATGGLVGANNSDRKQQVPFVRFSYAKIPVSATHPYNYTPNPNDRIGNTAVYNPYNIKYGGLVGCNENGVTQDSFARGNISGGDRVGGLVGCTIEGAIFRSYSTGTATRNIYPGAVIDGSTLPAYEGGVGGLVGRVNGSLPPGLGGTQGQGSVQNAYWDTQTSGTTSSAGGSGYTTAQMKIQSNFINWDFVSVWGIDAGINDGYPFLKGTSTSVFYYRSKANSAWSQISTWEYSPDNVSFSSAVVVPDLSNSISILINHIVALDIDETIDQTTISGTGKLTINSGKTLLINNGDGIDLAINGELIITGTFSVGTAAVVSTGSSSLITFNGSVAQSTGTGFPSPLNNLTIANAAGVTFNSPTGISGVPLVINGVLKIDSGFVSGLNDTDGYHSVGLNYLEIGETGTNITGFSASTSVVPGNFPDRIERQWSISGNLSDTKILTFYWTSADDHSYAWGSKIPSAYVGNSEYTPTSGNFSVTSDPRWLKISISSFEAAKGTWTIGESNEETLPVELSSFTATLTSLNLVQLHWVTQSETNVAGFRIYRGLSNIPSEAMQLGVFIPATNSSQAQHYMYEDKELNSAGYYYYWLESNDLDGDSELFGPVGVEYAISGHQNNPVPLVTSLQAIYPNPFNPSTSISYTLEKDSPVRINIYNQRGQMVRQWSPQNTPKGYHRLVWDGRDDNGKSVSSGIYLMKLNLGGELFTRKLTLQK